MGIFQGNENISTLSLNFNIKMYILIKNYYKFQFRLCKNYLKKKPWVQPLAVAGSHLTEEAEEKENVPEKGKKNLYLLYKNI